MSDFNPYQAPSEAAQTEVPGLEGFWKVEAGVLSFRDGAQLPKLDIRSGRRDIPLTPASSEFVVRTGFAGMLPSLIRVALLFGMFGGALFAVSKGYYSSSVWILGSCVMLFVISGIVAERCRQRVRLRWWVDAEVEARALKRRQWAARFSLVATGLLLTSIFLEDVVPRWLGWSGLAVSWLVTVVVNRVGGRLVCRSGRDGWFVLKGLMPDVLTELASQQPDEMERWQQRRTRTRRVFTAFLFRSPARVLAGKQAWNPVALLLIMIYKLTRSRFLTRECFAHSEAEELKSSEWDPKLRKLWDGLQGDEAFEGWRLLASRKLGSPLGDLHSEWMTLVSPGNEHALVFAVVRLTTAGVVQEVLETTFRSWTADGRLLVTSNSVLQRPLPANYDVVRQAGPPCSLLKAHMRRVGGAELVPAAFPDGWQRRMTEDVETRHACLEAAGVYGPIREEKFPDVERMA
ncbi:hypothetical protein [Haloferula rosea]|uniref:Uncharacterized protein n=1 Tax=Haloferula rosea TaxID=490093 RepID=A0A934RCL2_9BACT|nr:hypothetical protein [Haloferula rosea]MBK1826556.1 hypothetical protein [Haloferula rosea]